MMCRCCGSRMSSRAPRGPRSPASPVSSGPFGLALSPRRGAARSSPAARMPAHGAEGRTVALIDVSRATPIAEVPVGSDFAGQASRPTAVAFAPDGRLYVTCATAGTVSRIEASPRGGWRETARVALRGAGGAPARPRGIAVTADGRFVLACGRTAPGSREQPPVGARGRLARRAPRSRGSATRPICLRPLSFNGWRDLLGDAPAGPCIKRQRCETRIHQLLSRRKSVGFRQGEDDARYHAVASS